jgi:hypothetical protein
VFIVEADKVAIVSFVMASLPIQFDVPMYEENTRRGRNRTYGLECVRKKKYA